MYKEIEKDFPLKLKMLRLDVGLSQEEFAKKIGITVGTFVMIYNVFLYVICGIVINSWILPLYSIVTYAAGLKTIDFIVEGIDRSKGVMIITEKPEEVGKALMDAFECGLTKMDAKGGYSNKIRN